MKNNKNIIIISCILILVFSVVFFFIISLSNSAKENNTNNEKIISEISYLSMRISNIYINLEKEIINWNELKEEIKNIYSSWNFIVIDLTELQIKNTDLTSFGRTLDNLSIAISEKNTRKMFSNISDLYNFLTIYINSIDSSNQINLELKSKIYLLKAYSLVDTDNWNLIDENIINAEKIYYNYLNNVNTVVENNSKINEIYISIKELENSLILRNKDILVIKLKIILENY